MKDEHENQPIFLFVFSGSPATKSQVHYCTKIELKMSRVGPNTFSCFNCAYLVDFYPT